MTSTAAPTSVILNVSSGTVFMWLSRCAHAWRMGPALAASHAKASRFAAASTVGEEITDTDTRALRRSGDTSAAMTLMARRVLAGSGEVEGEERMQ